MTPTADIDRVLASWLAEGFDRAPEDRTRAAMTEVAVTRQRPTVTGLFGPGIHGSRLLAAAVVGVIAVVIGLGVGLQAGVIRIQDPEALPPPSSSVPPMESVAPDASPPSDSEGQAMVVYNNPRLGYEVSVPASWSPLIDHTVGQSVVRFGGLTVSLGDTDGDFYLRRTGTPGSCASRHATSRDDVEAAIRELSPDSRRTETNALLSGWPATIEYGRDPDSAYPYLVYSIINDRPVVLTFSLPILRDQGVTPAQAMAMVRDFRLIGVRGEPPRAEQPEAVDGYRTFVAPDGSFEVRLPETWSATFGDDPSALYLRDRLHELSIRAGDDDGSVRTCEENAGGWESCETIQAATLGGLANEIGLRATGSSVVFQGPLRSSTTLDGEDAMRVHIVRGPSAHTVTYWVALHDGRPFVLRFAVAGGVDPTADVFSAIPDGFYFVDE
jgi:hypothetical protein